MNKKEVSEIKKQFKENNKSFNIERLANAYVMVNGGVKEIKFFSNRNFALMPENEVDFYLQNCKKTLGGQLGKGIVEYPFPKEEYDPDGKQALLFNLLKSELKDDSLIKDYIDFLLSQLNYTENFYISIAYCSYDVPTKDKNDEEMDEESVEVYNFLLFSFNYSEVTDIGLYFNENSQVVEKKLNTDMQILKAPFEGFLFPVFSDRTADINNVLYFTKTPKIPNEDMIASVLGCEYHLSSEDEKEKFAVILTDCLGDHLNYDLVTSIHENIRNVIKAGEVSTDMVSLNKNEIRRILQHSGVCEKDLEKFDEAYERELEGLELKAVNMIDSSKLGVKIPDISLNIKPQGANKVSSQLVNNKKCIVIEIDEGIEVNGLDIVP